MHVWLPVHLNIMASPAATAGGTLSWMMCSAAGALPDSSANVKAGDSGSGELVAGTASLRASNRYTTQVRGVSFCMLGIQR